MATLGILLLWAGYTTGVFGFAKIKAAYGASPSLSISDLALPSHRTTYLTAATAWTTSSGTAATSTASGSGTGSGATKSTVPSPSPAPSS